MTRLIELNTLRIAFLEWTEVLCCYITSPFLDAVLIIFPFVLAAYPHTCTDEWAAATLAKKTGKLPIYWESRNCSGGGDDDDDDDDDDE